MNDRVSWDTTWGLLALLMWTQAITASHRPPVTVTGHHQSTCGSLWLIASEHNTLQNWGMLWHGSRPDISFNIPYLSSKAPKQESLQCLAEGVYVDINPGAQIHRQTRRHQESLYIAKKCTLGLPPPWPGSRQGENDGQERPKPLMKDYLFSIGLCCYLLKSRWVYFWTCYSLIYVSILPLINLVLIIVVLWGILKSVSMKLLYSSPKSFWLF